MGDSNKIDAPRTMKIVFGIFMVLIYFAMGAMMFTDFFFWMPQWTRIAMGSLFVVYGIWRCYRQVRVVKVEKGEEDEK